MNKSRIHHNSSGARPSRSQPQASRLRNSSGLNPDLNLNLNLNLQSQSARGLAHSKTLRAIRESSENAKRFGVRRPSAAFNLNRSHPLPSLLQKWCLPFLAALALCTALAFSAPAQTPPQSNAAPDSLLFRDGDLLYGELLAINPQNAVRWRHPDAAQPIEFKPDTIAQIDFPQPKNSTAPASNACRVLLANGDSLDGGLLSYDREVLALQTWYAGRLSIPRASLQSLVLIRPSPAIFDGITGLEGWTQAASAAAMPGDTGQWTYRNGAFYASKVSSIARDLKLPDVAEIQFDLAWKGALNLAVALYTDSLQPVQLNLKEQAPDFGGFYSFRFQSSVIVDMIAIKKLDPLRDLGQVILPSLNSKDRVHVDLRVSKPQHKIALALDDALIKEWVDPQGFIGEGTAMRFVQNLGSVVKLSNLRITQWDGFFEDTAASADTTDVCWLENGKRTECAIESIGNGKMAIRTTNGPVEIPLDQLNAINFAHRQPGPAQTEAATVRATFAQGGGLSFILESWRKNEMIIRSADFGKARLNPAAFTRLQFLTPEKKPAPEPKG